jgi:hypothetical protein
MCFSNSLSPFHVRLHLKCDGIRTETRFHLSAKRRSPFKLAGASVQSTTGNRSVRISDSNGSNAGYTMFWGSVKSTGNLLHMPVSPSLPLLCVTVCHHISTGLYHKQFGIQFYFNLLWVWVHVHIPQLTHWGQGHLNCLNACSRGI